jgi:uncharacterized protein YhaN
VEAPLSSSLCRQVQAALRLALAEQMEGDESLPIVLDELTAGWDDRRIRAGLETLSRIAERRQVLLLTARPGLARQLETDAGARVLTLPDSPTPVDDTNQEEAPAATDPQAVS